MIEFFVTYLIMSAKIRKLKARLAKALERRHEVITFVITQQLASNMTYTPGLSDALLIAFNSQDPSTMSIDNPTGYHVTDPNATLPLVFDPNDGFTGPPTHTTEGTIDITTGPVENGGTTIDDVKIKTDLPGVTKIVVTIDDKGTVPTIAGESKGTGMLWPLLFASLFLFFILGRKREDETYIYGGMSEDDTNEAGNDELVDGDYVNKDSNQLEGDYDESTFDYDDSSDYDGSQLASSDSDYSVYGSEYENGGLE